MEVLNAPARFTSGSVVGGITSAAALMELPIGSTPIDSPRSRVVGAAARSRNACGSATPRHLRLRWVRRVRLRLGDLGSSPLYGRETRPLRS